MGAVLEMKILVPSALAVCLGLAGCGNDSDSFMMGRLLTSSVTARLSDGPAPAPAFTRAALANIVTPVQLVTREKTGQKAVVAKIADNQGVETWSSVDKVTLSLRQGVVVATRGFGEDLMAAEVPGTATLSQSGAGYARAHTLLNGLDAPVRTIYNCKITERSPQSIVVIELSYKTTHVVEMCSAGDQTFQNEFWFEGNGKIRKSRQWVSQGVGHMIVEDLRR